MGHRKRRGSYVVTDVMYLTKLPTQRRDDSRKQRSQPNHQSGLPKYTEQSKQRKVVTWR